MSYQYSDPKQADDPHALPDFETFKGYVHECRECDTTQGLFPDYYGLLHLDSEECRGCGKVGTLRCVDTKAQWYYAWLDGGLDCYSSEPYGPFATQAEAIAAAREEASE